MSETPMQLLKGSLRGEESGATFDQAVREIREPASQREEPPT